MLVQTSTFSFSRIMRDLDKADDIIINFFYHK